MTNKGPAIRIKKGKYFEIPAWLNESKLETPKCYYVIVDMGNGVLHKTRLLKSSIVILETGPPASYSEALLRQNPDIEMQLDKLCQELAKCSVHHDGTGFFAIMQNKINEARQTQNSLGGKATYRIVHFNG
jgi:hypothetical protein